MSKSSKEYWADREAEQLKHNIKDEQHYDRRIKQIYADMLDNVQKEIDSFYGKYAAKEGITLAEAKKRVSKLDIEAYERKAKRYVKDKDFSPQANEEMRLYNLTMKVNRLEMLKANIGLELINGHQELENFMADILQGRTEDELKRQAGILGKTIKNNAQLANSIVNASFHGASFSDRIWQYQSLMKADLSKLLQSGLIAGKSPRLLAKDLKKHFGASTFNAERLMRTELARVQTDAQKQSFERNGFDWYEFICNKNPSKHNTCDICRGLDGKHFKVKDMMPGTNAPPMHPHCRCSTAAFEDSQEYENWLDFLDKGGTTEEYNKLKAANKLPVKRKSLTNNSSSGIIQSKKEQLKPFTKVKVEDIPSMDESKFNTMKSSLEKKGIAVIQDAEGDAYLKFMGAEAMTLSDGSAVIFQSGRVPSASATFEEIIHTTQIKNKGMIESTGDKQGTIEYLNREIEANEKLLKYQKAYELTDKDIESVKENLEMYYKKLKEVKSNV